MQEIEGDIWEFTGWVGVTTNGVVTQDGTLVMGGGIALAAATKFPKLPKVLGDLVSKYGNHVYFIPEFRVFSFPTKEHWRDPSPVGLLFRSCLELRSFMLSGFVDTCLLVPPGCGLGGLNYQDLVGPILRDLFKDLPLTIVDNGGNIK